MRTKSPVSRTRRSQTVFRPGVFQQGLEYVVGTISSVAFASGDQFVIGCWQQTPVGAMSDVMWLDPSGTRTLIASSEAAADYITGIYEFDVVKVAELQSSSCERSTTVVGAGIDLHLRSGRRIRFPGRRPLSITRLVEAPIARRLMGVEVYGTTPTGAREWYQASALSWVGAATATIGGEDLGSVVDLTRPMGVGFSNPPARPSIVSIRVAIQR